MKRDRVEQGDIQFHCKDCDYYGLCNYYSNRKETSLICKNFHYSRPKGEWLNKKEVAVNSRNQILYEAKCSLCNVPSYFRGCGEMLVGANTCPNCGADMRGTE